MLPGLLIQYTEPDLQLINRLGLTSCELLIFPDSPLSPTAGATEDDWRRARQRLRTLNLQVSAIGSYTNHLDPDPAAAQASLDHLKALMALAPIMDCDTISTFAGRDPEKPIEQNIPAFKRAFAPLCQQAEDLGLRIAIENCPMFIGWPFRGINFAHTPDAWNLMFNAVPSPALGLEYDPSHLICQGIDPVPLIAEYGSRIFHVHAKDAEIEPAALQRYGIMDRRTARHRMPGLGQAPWPTIVRELKSVGYTGNLDIEGRHDPEYTGDREEQGLQIAVAILRKAIATASNPVVNPILEQPDN